MPKPNQLSCRPEQFAGAWACDPQALDAYEAGVRAILESGQLEVVSLASSVMNGDGEDELYTVDADGIAHFPIDGMITKYPTSFRSRLGGTDYTTIRKVFSSAAADPNVKGGLMEVDSPGGLHNGVEQAAAAIADFRKVKPLDAHIHGTGCSAAYRLACEADHISIDPTAMTGSIGSKFQIKDTSELYRRAGVKALHFASGEHKLDGAAGREITADQISRFQQIADDAGATFVDAVTDRRGLDETQKSEVAKAGVFTPKRALASGLVDAIGFTDDALNHLKQRIASGGSGRAGARATGSKQPDPAANPHRSPIMALTPEQLTQAKNLPGCGDISADNAPERLLASATSLQNVASSAATENTRLAGELSQARASATLNSPATPREIAMARTLAQSKIQSLSGTKLSPACATALADALVGTDAAPVVAALTPDNKGVTLASTILEALASNEGVLNANGVQQTTAQPVGRTIPGEPSKQTEAELQAEVDANLGRTDLGRRALAARNGH